jgi:hypothetical protein
MEWTRERRKASAFSGVCRVKEARKKERKGMHARA